MVDLHTHAMTDRPAPASAGPLRTVLITVIAVAALVIAASAGWLLRGNGSSGPTTPSATSVDAGFARDMATHHTQAVIMAGYERDTTSDSQLRLLAYDIETQQQFQIGEMQGWLDDWNISRNSAHPMAWMGAHHAAMVKNGLMPGMATPAQMTKLETLHGTALDTLFLQLMIHHHQGGLAMAQYAVEHAQKSYVRDLAQSIINSQQAELITMEQTLTTLGAAPLPAPSS